MKVDKSKIKEETSIQFSRSSGPGGQHVNKVNTRVELFFDIKQSECFNQSDKQQILEKLKSQLDKLSRLRVVDQHSRSQLKNKNKAFDKLFNLLESALERPKKRIPTKPSKAKKNQTLKAKKQRSAIKKLRGRVKRNENLD